MRKKSILVFGLITAMFLVSIGSFTGHAGLIEPDAPYGALVILPNLGCCNPHVESTCWADKVGCGECCNEGYEFYRWINDRACCGCCYMPWP